jgi:hypothetical protein
MTFERTERGEHRLTLHIVNEDGAFVIPAIEGNFRVEMPKDSRIASVNLVLNLGQLKFNDYGEYAINLAIDGRQEATLSFWVKEPSKKNEA